MSSPNWNDLLPSYRAIQTMTPEQLKSAGQAVEEYGMTLGYGIAAIGSLLAGYASNEDHGIDSEAMTDLGWLLRSLGSLSAKLSDTGSNIDTERKTRQAIQTED